MPLQSGGWALACKQWAMCGLWVAVIGALSPALGQTPQAPLLRYQARVSEVVDGDTVHLQPLGGRQEVKARLLGIDAPEICQAFGREAHDALSRRLNNMMVTVESNRQDDYGRALARIYLNGEDIGGWMVRQGLAWSYGAGRSKGPYRPDEQEARAARRGLFMQDDAIKPAQFRRKFKSCYTGGHEPQPKKRQRNHVERN